MSLSYESAIISSRLFSFFPSPPPPPSPCAVSSLIRAAAAAAAAAAASTTLSATFNLHIKPCVLCYLAFSCCFCLCFPCFNFTSWVDEVDVSECTRAPLLKCAVCSAERRDLFLSLSLSLLSAFSHESNYSRRRRVPPMPPQYRSLIIIHTQAGRHFIHFLYTDTASAAS